MEGQLGVEHGWREQAVPRPSRAIQVPSVLLPKHKYVSVTSSVWFGLTFASLGRRG